MVKHLLRMGATHRLRDNRGDTPLHVAARWGSLEIAELLLDAGAEIDARNHHGATPLLLASETGSAKLIQLLAQNGADILAVCRCKHTLGLTPLDLAVQRGHETLAGLLRDNPRQEPSHPKAVQAYLAAAEKGRLLELKRWLERGVDINVRDASGFSALSLAASANHMEIVRFLLGAGKAVVDFQDEGGHTALWWAAWHGHLEMGSTAEVRRLLRTGNHQDFADPKGVVPLMFAAKLGRTDVMEVLLEHGGDLEIRDSDGATALCWAASCSSASASEREKALQLLLDRGANHNIRDNDGMTPLMLALETPRENLGAVKLLVSRGADVNIADNKGCTALFHATRWVLSTLLTEVVEVLLHAGADVGHRNDDGLTALYWAARRGHIAAVTMLLEAAAKLSESESNEVGGSALCNAAVSGREAVAALLIARGVDINFRDARGQTPLLLACEKGQIAIAEMLISHGADSSAKDSQGQTALALAQKAGNSSVVKLL
ncbi:ankyrin repeat-containing domain protein, partial [Cercophora newfieldiana]